VQKKRHVEVTRWCTVIGSLIFMDDFPRKISIISCSIIIFIPQKSSIIIVARLRKMTCDLRHPMSFRHRVISATWNCWSLATNYRYRLRKMIHEDKASYDCTPPCNFNMPLFLLISATWNCWSLIC